MLYTAIYVIIIISMKVVCPLIMGGQRTQFDHETQDAGSGVGVGLGLGIGLGDVPGLSLAILEVSRIAIRCLGMSQDRVGVCISDY